MWLVPARPVKRIAWSTWSWRRVVLRWTLQIPVIRGKKDGTFPWNKDLDLICKKIMTIISASRDVTYVFESSQQKPILAPISGTMQSLRPRSLDSVWFSRPKYFEIISQSIFLSDHLLRHVHMGEAKHSRVKSIPCPHCQKMFSRKGHMTEHVRTVHEGKKRIYKEVPFDSSD